MPFKPAYRSVLVFCFFDEVSLTFCAFLYSKLWKAVYCTLAPALVKGVNYQSGRGHMHINTAVENIA